ncbi:MAG: EutN/CcmL family microcompartment protein [Firmicutes bacterium]|nr:EutN/CcmL family microcompartment protein [Bacillota bacterium]
MQLGRVVGHVWATRKDEALTGVKFLVVRIIEKLPEEGDKILVAADTIGAGVGEKVLVARGSSARRLSGLLQAPIDASVIGIIDEETGEMK